MIVDIGKYYLYRHIRLDKNQPFYIGVAIKKVGKNPYARSQDKKDRTDLWKNIAAKTDYRIEILLETDDEKFLYKKEIEFIKLYGRIVKRNGTLANISVGGQIISEFSDEVRKNISKRLTGHKVSEITKAKIREARKKQIIKSLCKEGRLKISKANSGEKNGMYGKKGAQHPESRPVYHYKKNGDFIQLWDCARSITRETGISYKLVHDRCKHKVRNPKTDDNIFSFVPLKNF